MSGERKKDPALFDHIYYYSVTSAGCTSLFVLRNPKIASNGLASLQVREE